jgi:predicted transcriptional regulator
MEMRSKTGRKRNPQKKEVFSVCLTPVTVEELWGLAHTNKTSASNMARKFIEEGILKERRDREDGNGSVHDTGSGQEGNQT